LLLNIVLVGLFVYSFPTWDARVWRDNKLSSYWCNLKYRLDTFPKIIQVGTWVYVGTPSLFLKNLLAWLERTYRYGIHIIMVFTISLGMKERDVLRLSHACHAT